MTTPDKQKLADEIEMNVRLGCDHRFSDDEAKILIVALRAPKAGEAKPVAWRPIETAPRDGTRILATGGGLNDQVDIAAYVETVSAWSTTEYTLDDRDDEAEGYNRPTHWQPLPAPLDAVPPRS